ncbi:MAG: hypothetical protein IT203_02645 [Fimbriimonadaceae bacterium]|nr:hypothetical protein [Fimbriimonadaceae bacterium]
MTEKTRKLIEEAMKKAPQPDLRRRTGVNESRPMTDSELEEIGGNVPAIPDDD